MRFSATASLEKVRGTAEGELPDLGKVSSRKFQALETKGVLRGEAPPRH